MGEGNKVVLNEDNDSPEKLVDGGVVDPLDQPIGQLAPDELENLDHREDALAVVGHLKTIQY